MSVMKPNTAPHMMRVCQRRDEANTHRHRTHFCGTRGMHMRNAASPHRFHAIATTTTDTRSLLVQVQCSKGIIHTGNAAYPCRGFIALKTAAHTNTHTYICLVNCECLNAVRFSVRTDTQSLPREILKEAYTSQNRAQMHAYLRETPPPSTHIACEPSASLAAMQNVDETAFGFHFSYAMPSSS